MTEDIMTEVAGVDHQHTMPPHSPVQQFEKHQGTSKRRLEDNSPISSKKMCHSYNLKEAAEDSRPPSPLEDSLIYPMDVCQSTNKDDENKENQIEKTESTNFDSILAKTLLAGKEKEERKEEGVSPRVIVEHQPLPSIYELGQMSRDVESSYVKNVDQDSDDEYDDEGSMFDPPGCNIGPAYKPGLIYNDRFWSGNFNSTPSCPTPPPPLPIAIPSPPISQTSPPVSTYQFLDQSNQRIECDENGKSYLQLGTVNHQHLPVTPVIQPKPTTLVHRRPIPCFRPPIPINSSRAPQSPCDHSSCLGRRTSLCYKQQRSRILNMSLHKLHMARQRADSSLRRSVLICNMLRYIEEETDQEVREQEANYNETSQDNDQASYNSWNNHNPQNLNTFASPAPNTYRDNNNFSNDSFEAPLKDFNSAFRQTPIPSSNEVDHGIEEERGINWSSVLSLSSQSHLDPLNNNSFTDTWSNGSNDLADVDLSQHSFDDINWKLTPVTADDVIKAFPNDESLFICGS